MNDYTAVIYNLTLSIIKFDFFIYFRHLAMMPGYSESDNALATKLVSFYPHNADRPTHQAWVMLFDPLSGSLPRGRIIVILYEIVFHNRFDLY